MIYVEYAARALLIFGLCYTVWKDISLHGTTTTEKHDAKTGVIAGVITLGIYWAAGLFS